MRRILIALIFAIPLWPQPTIYLRAPGYAGFVVTGVSNATPAVVQTASAHGLNAGDTVTIWGVMASVSGSCVSSTANGLRTVRSVIDSTHFAIADLSGNSIAANGPWCDGGISGKETGGPQAGGKVQAFTPVAEPRGWLDGPTGTVMRKLALGTNNGLVSLVVSGNVATATTSYNHGIAAGNQVGVWGSGVTALDNSGKPYTITSATSTTFTFTTSGVASGTYSNSNNTCGANANQDCLRISQLAWTGSIFWDAAVNRDLSGWEIGNGYKHVFDGGTLYGGALVPEAWGLAALKAIVDPADTQMVNIARYCVDHIERASGVSWTINEQMQDGLNNDLNDYASYIAYGASICYMGARPYLSAAEKQTFADKMYNGVDWLTGTTCNKTHTGMQQEILATGTAQGGSATTIVVAATDSAADGYYVNNVIQATVSGNLSYGLVTGYTASTKTATVASWSNGTPASGTAYSIFATATIGSTAAGTTTEITGYNTHFTTDFQVGDAIEVTNNLLANNFVQSAESYVSVINSDTSMTVINSSSSVASTSVPSIVWILHQWQPGDCGLRWAQNHWGGAMGASPSLYPPNGGVLSAVQITGTVPQTPTLGGNNGYTRTAAWTALNLELVDDDARAIPALAESESQFWDWHMRLTWNYSTGLEHSGAAYSFGRVELDGQRGVFALAQSVPALASGMDLTGNWVSQVPMMQMYATYPDRRWDGYHFDPWPTRWGASTAVNAINGSYSAASWQTQPSFYWLPNDIRTQYFFKFASTFCCVFHGTDLNPWADIWDQGSAWFGLMAVDPRITGADYTVQPNQYAFVNSSAATACANTGWSCPASTRADGVISHTGWGSLASPNLTATQVFFDARSFVGDHDAQEMGSLRIYKVGHLLNMDNNPPGNGIEQSDTTTIDTVPRLGGRTATQSMQGPPTTNNPAASNITRWASASHGTWDMSYGDANSRYAYAMADLTGAYLNPPNRAQRHMIHFKKPGTEEIVIQFDDIDVSNTPTQVETHIHYAQNGETNIDGYNEGNTTCPGNGGCSALNSSRLIQSMEDGNSDGRDPVRQYGIISSFLSPGTIFVRDDGSSYQGGNGHTHRVSLCGGSSCGATVSQFEAFIVHKIASGLSDTSLTAKLLSPDPAWAGLETTDAAGTAGKVALIARGGRTPFNAILQTDHPGTGQYLIAGLQPGFVYDVNRNADGTNITSQAVSNGDSSLYFEAPAGSYSIFPDGMRNLFLRPALPKVQAQTPFEYSFPPAGSAPVFQWSVSGGQLPPGLSLSAGGILSGTASQTGTFTFTVTAQAIGYPAVSESASFTAEVTAAGLNLNIKALTTSQAVLVYGLRGLSAVQSCTLTVSTQPDFSNTVENFTDGGGTAIRWHVVGATLQPAQIYYAQANCGASLSPTIVSFSTPATVTPRQITVPISVRALGTQTATVQLQYGSTPQMGNAINVACASGCTVEVPFTSDTLLYTRRVYLDSASRVLAASSVGVVGIP